MKVAIDVQALGTQAGGDETYMRNVVRSLVRVEPENDYLMLLAQPLSDLGIPEIDRLPRLVLRQKLFRRIPISIPLAVARERVDILHAQYAGPPFCTAPVVVTVHDISYERYPQFFTHNDLLLMRTTVPPAARRAAMVLTDSEYSKQDIVRRYRVPPEKITVTHLAADPIFQPLHDEPRLQSMRDRYGTGQRYILCVGNLQPRKNLVSLIDAYVRLRQADVTRHKLVLVGRKAFLYDDVFAAARASGLEQDLVFTDYVPQDDLTALYNAADVFVYPSIFEGFGIPPLEAMACGTPVITSNTSSLPEVVGDAALTIDPFDRDALTQALAAVLTTPDLSARLSVQGLERSRMFSWDTTARRIAHVYRQVVQPSEKMGVPAAASG